MFGIDARDWPVISEWLDRAMDLPPESHGAWLDALPPEAESHRDTLRRLLGAFGGVETNGMFQELPRAGLEALADEDGATALAAGTHVGPYVLLSQIGRGGMGSVWLADRADALPRRKIALKLPHLGDRVKLDLLESFGDLERERAGILDFLGEACRSDLALLWLQAAAPG